MSDFSDIPRRKRGEQCQPAGCIHRGTVRVGILAGMSRGTINNASATGTVTAGAYGGGLVGESSGSVANSWAAVTVAGTTTTSSSMGGLIGWNNAGGTIQDSYATGNVTAGTGGTRAGGLTAQSNGSILRSYATGAVSGGSQGVGGLVGFNTGATIVNSYATGAVTAQPSQAAWSASQQATSIACDRSRDHRSLGGGLVGTNGAGASIDRSYATGAVNVTSSTIATLMEVDWSPATPEPSPSPMRPGPSTLRPRMQRPRLRRRAG